MSARTKDIKRTQSRLVLPGYCWYYPGTTLVVDGRPALKTVLGSDGLETSIVATLDECRYKVACTTI
eukprot:scaffold551944_cov45-Prasinocladus_malaysianus.AAC.1